MSIFYILTKKKCNFLKESIDKLNKNIKYLIYNELVRKFKDNDNNKSVDYKEMKEIIYKQFLNDLENINSIIELIDSLENKDKISFLKELMKKCKFTKNEFYSNNENTKISLLCELYTQNKLEKTKDSNYLDDFEIVIQEIRDDLEGNIEIKILKDFLNNKKELIIKRLGLIKIILKEFDIEKIYEDLTKIIEDVKRDIDDLNSIKNSLNYFHKEKFKEEIKNISNIVKGDRRRNYKNL